MVRKRGYAKKGAFIGLVVGVVALILLILLWGLQPLYFFGKQKCTNFHSDLWKCDFGYLWIYLIISLIGGIAVCIISTLLGLFIGYSIENKYVLYGGFAILGVDLFLEILSFFSSPISEFLYGDGAHGILEVILNGTIAFIIGAIIGFIIGKIKSPRRRK